MQTRYLNFVFILAMTLILCVTYISYMQIGKFITANDWIIHSQKVMLVTDNVLLDLLGLESKVRAYLISGDENFIVEIKSETSQIYQDYQILKNLTVDNPQQQEYISKLEPLLNERFNIFKASIKSKKLNEMQTKTGADLVHDGQEITAQIKAITKEIYYGEMAILQKREDATLLNFNYTVYLTSLATAINILFLTVILILFNRLLARFRSFNIKLESQTKEMMLISEMSNLLGISISRNESISIISNYLKKLLPFYAGIIYLLKSPDNYLESIAEWNAPAINGNVFSPDQCLALRQGKTHIYYDMEQSIPCEHIARNVDSPSCICVPLLGQNEIIGVLYLEIQNSTPATHEATVHTVQLNQLLIQNLAGQIALSLSNLKLNAVLKTRSSRDSLTNLYNRTYLTERMEIDLQRAKRNNISIAIVMMDLDHFKIVNDTYGHEAGDDMLKKISKLLMDNIRQSDICCRYGGDEFFILFYDTDLESAVIKLEKLRIAIADLQFNSRGIIYSITASFGVAMYPEHCGEDAAKLINAADEALYESKHNGKNKITVYKKP